MAESDPTTLARILRDHAALARRMAASHEATRSWRATSRRKSWWRYGVHGRAFRRQCSERTYVARIAHNRIVSHIAARCASRR